MRRLPSLNALVTFEAAVRLGSFTSAASELGVTQGAVSRGVAGLEAWLGAPLFERAGKSATPTAAGLAYADDVGAALDRLEGATTRALATSGDRPLEIDVPPTLAMRWLVPRLPLFQARQPGRLVRINTGSRPVSAASTFDVAVRRGPRHGGLRGKRILDEHATPVCSPRLAAKRRITSPRDLTQATLLAADTRDDAWPRWFAAQGLPAPKPSSFLRFDHYYVALQAAQDGLGVAMGASPLLDDDVERGDLVPLFPDLRVRAASYYAFTREARPRVEVAAFVDWLVELGASASRG